MQTSVRKARPFRRFLKDRQGASMIELAIAFPIFILMIVGIVELAMLMVVQVTVEGGLREASRFGITGQDPGAGTTREQKIAEIVSGHTHNLVKIEPDDIELLVYEDFSSIGKPEPYEDDDPNDGDFDEAKGDQFIPEQHDKNGNGVWDKDRGDTSQGAGDSGAVVLYRVTFEWDFMTPFFSAAAGTKTVDLEAAVAVRNEPWPDEG